MKLTKGTMLIAIERNHQIKDEGYTTEHDDHNCSADMAVAGACYVLDMASKWSGQHATWQNHYEEEALLLWPCEKTQWNPTPDDPIRQLVKAGALIAAEIDRLDGVKHIVRRQLEIEASF